VSAYPGELQRRGVDYSTPDAAVFLGESACNALRQGQSVAAVIDVIRGSFSGHDTGIILGAAANTFCPDQLSTIQGFIDNHQSGYRTVPTDNVQCHVGGGGELWCEDYDTGESWEQAPGGSYPYPPCNWANPHCNG
jgi:hypothetical protein